MPGYFLRKLRYPVPIVLVVIVLLSFALPTPAEAQSVDEIISLPTLDVGITGGSYKCVPAQGWQSGTYTFKIEVYAQDKLCAESPEQQLEVISTAAGINLALLIAIAGGVLLLITIIIVIMIARRRRKELGRE